MWLFQRRTPGQGAFAMAGSDSISLRVRQTPGRCQINAPQPRHGRRPRTKLIPMPIIKVEMLKGRTLEQKRELADVMTREYVRICGGRPDAIYVVIDDVEKENWAVGGQLLADKYPETK